MGNVLLLCLWSNPSTTQKTSTTANSLLPLRNYHGKALRYPYQPAPQPAPRPCRAATSAPWATGFSSYARSRSPRITKKSPFCRWKSKQKQDIGQTTNQKLSSDLCVSKNLSKHISQAALLAKLLGPWKSLYHPLVVPAINQHPYTPITSRLKILSKSHGNGLQGSLRHCKPSRRPTRSLEVGVSTKNRSPEGLPLEASLLLLLLLLLLPTI